MKAAEVIVIGAGAYILWQLLREDEKAPDGTIVGPPPPVDRFNAGDPSITNTAATAPGGKPDGVIGAPGGGPSSIPSTSDLEAKADIISVTKIGGSSRIKGSAGGTAESPVSLPGALPPAVSITQPADVIGNMASAPFTFPWTEINGRSARNLSRDFGGADRIYIASGTGGVSTLQSWLDWCNSYANERYHQYYSINGTPGNKSEYLIQWEHWMGFYLTSWNQNFNGSFLPKLRPPAVWPDFGGSHNRAWEFAFFNGAWWAGEMYKDADGNIVPSLVPEEARAGYTLNPKQA